MKNIIIFMIAITSNTTVFAGVEEHSSIVPILKLSELCEIDNNIICCKLVHLPTLVYDFMAARYYTISSVLTILLRSYI